MNIEEEIANHRIPCGPMTMKVDGVCRRKLRDAHNEIMDKLSDLTTQDYTKPQAPKGHEIKDGKIVQKGLGQDPESKSKKMLKEGLAKNKVKLKLKEHAASLEPEKEPEPALEERKKMMLDEAKMKAEVKVKAKEHEKKLEGNSKLLQDTSGKINKR
jgi:hypothetical protein